MLRGCKRTVVYVKDTESKIFEEAYFVLRRGLADCGKMPREDEMMKEAKRLISGSVPFIYPSGKRHSRAGRFIGAFILGVAACSLVIGTVALVMAGVM